MSAPNDSRTSHSRDDAAKAALAAVADAVAKLRYGAIELTVHDGRVVQLEVTERQRFN